MKYLRRFIAVVMTVFLFSHFGCISPSGNTVAVTELYTATWCLGCIFSHKAIDEIYKEYGRDKFIAIEYYVDSTADHPYPRLSCKESEDRMKGYTGEQYKTEFPFHLNTELYKNDLSIILFVQDMETKQILQGLEIELKE